MLFCIVFTQLGKNKVSEVFHINLAEEQAATYRAQLQQITSDKISPSRPGQSTRAEGVAPLRYVLIAKKIIKPTSNTTRFFEQ